MYKYQNGDLVICVAPERAASENIGNAGILVIVEDCHGNLRREVVGREEMTHQMANLYEFASAFHHALRVAVEHSAQKRTVESR